MDAKKKKKILVPVDGSDRSLNTVRYVAGNPAFRNMRIVLLHVFSSLPEAYLDMESDVRSKQVIKQAKAWERQQRKDIQAFLEKAKKVLIKAGIPERDVGTRIQDRRKGIARDIIREAKKGYSAVIARRRGLNAMRGVVVGSVTAKLIQKIDFVPLIIAGRNPKGRKILVGFDGSEDALRAVDFVGAVTAGCNYAVSLLHVIRSKENTYSNSLLKAFEKEAAQEMTSSSYLAAKKLVSWGLEPESITTQTVKGKRSRARTIFEEAKKNAFGTIVVGRRGRSRVRDFFIGRVANKIIYLARDPAVWIVP